MTNAFGINRTLGAGILSIALVTIVSSVLVLLSLQSLAQASKVRLRSYEILGQIDAFRVAMLNQETGIRGYIITGDPANLDPYRQGRPALDAALQKLRALDAANPAQLAMVGEAEAAARAWQERIAKTAIADMADPGSRAAAAALEKSSAGKELFDRFRQRLTEIGRQESARLARQQMVADRARSNSFMALLAGTILDLLICSAAAYALNRRIARPLTDLSKTMGALLDGDLSAPAPHTKRRDEVGEMARAVQVFKSSLLELDRTSLLRAAAETLPAMIGYIDRRRRIGFLNSEFIRSFGLSAADAFDLRGKPFASVFTTRPFPGQGAQLETALAGTEIRFDYVLERTGERGRDIEAYFRPHLDPKGKVLGVVTLLTDITERKRLERRMRRQARELLRSNQELEQFAYVASHDLKAPLRGIENLITWIEEDLKGVLEGETRSNMGLVRNRVKRLETLLDDLLAYSRAGRERLKIDSVDTYALVRELGLLISPPEGFSIHASPELPILNAPRAPLTQVLQNLMANAVKHHDHPADGNIWVDARVDGDWSEFHVSDDGPGVPEAFRERVFGMFQTLRPRDEVEGSGMGLAIVKKLVERHGGKVWLEDRPAGRGLSVCFTWPRAMRERSDGSYRELAVGG